MAAARRIEPKKLEKDLPLATGKRTSIKQVSLERGETFWRANEIRLRAERRAGQLLKEMYRAGQRARPGDYKSERATSVGPSTLPTLKTLGISEDESSQWQKLAEIPEED